MKKIIYKPNMDHYLDDIERMSKLLLKNGCEADDNTIYRLWKYYSDNYAAGWLILPKNDIELLNDLLYCARYGENFEIIEE